MAKFYVRVRQERETQLMLDTKRSESVRLASCVWPYDDKILEFDLKDGKQIWPKKSKRGKK